MTQQTNNNKTIKAALLTATIATCTTTAANAAEWSGNIAAEGRLFNHDPISSRQEGNANISFSAQPEFYHSWDDNMQSFTFVPFVRVDQHDAKRSHADVRELTWLKAARDWELRLGIRKVFWGVTESQHLVDIINQTDAVENIDGEDKLGQPMINLALIRDWGTLDLFILPGFRERTFPGPEGRLRTIPYVDTSQARYQSSRKNKHIDFAARWSHYIGDWDLGVSYFNGTSRDPLFTLGSDSSGNPVLIPYYELINQLGLSAQVVKGDWLWKLEWISRGVDAGRSAAMTGGFEYTFVGIADSQMDLGVIGEYLYDNRDQQATTPFQNDMMVGARLTLNDVQSTEMLVGMIFDLDHNGRMFNLEASRRLGDAWKLSVELRTFADAEITNPLYSLRNDDYLQTELAWYF
jgi:hypothetical protein